MEFTLGWQKVRIGGICKVLGMIQPGMSADRRRGPAALPYGGFTRRCCAVTTDAMRPQAKLLQAVIALEAVAQSFNHHRGWRHEHE